MGLVSAVLTVIILITMLGALTGVLFYLKSDINKINKRLKVDEESDSLADVRLKAIDADLQANYASRRDLSDLGKDFDTRLSKSANALTDQLSTMNKNTQSRITDYTTSLNSEISLFKSAVEGELDDLQLKHMVQQEELDGMGTMFNTRQVTVDQDWALFREPINGNLRIHNNVPDSKAALVVGTSLNVVGKLGFAGVTDGYTLGTNGTELQLNLPTANSKFHLMDGADKPQHSFDVSGNVIHTGDVLAMGISRTGDDKDWLHLNHRGAASEGTQVHGALATDGGASIGEWVKVPNGILHVKEKLGVGTKTPTEALDVNGNAKVGDLHIGSYILFEEDGHLYIAKDTKTAKILKISGTDVWRLNTYNNVDGTAPGWGVNNMGQSVAF